LPAEMFRETSITASQHSRILYSKFRNVRFECGPECPWGRWQRSLIHLVLSV